MGPNDTLYITKGDVSNCFYRLGIEGPLCEVFGLPSFCVSIGLLWWRNCSGVGLLWWRDLIGWGLAPMGGLALMGGVAPAGFWRKNAFDIGHPKYPRLEASIMSRCMVDGHHAEQHHRENSNVGELYF